MLVFIFFVDAANSKIYGNELRKLIKPVTISCKTYPSKEKGIIYFPLVNMVTIALLSKEQCDEITSYSTKRYIGSMKI
jgi:hypothetical protein